MSDLGIVVFLLLEVLLDDGVEGIFIRIVGQLPEIIGEMLSYAFEVWGSDLSGFLVVLEWFDAGFWIEMIRPGFPEIIFDDELPVFKCPFAWFCPWFGSLFSPFERFPGFLVASLEA